MRGSSKEAGEGVLVAGRGGIVRISMRGVRVMRVSIGIRIWDYQAYHAWCEDYAD